MGGPWVAEYEWNFVGPQKILNEFAACPIWHERPRGDFQHGITLTRVLIALQLSRLIKIV